MNKNVIVVGGGIAGLTAAIYLARAGRTVIVFEKKRHLGGRAITHLRQGYRFNLGGHAVYRGGAGAQVYRELGIPLRGGVPKGKGSYGLVGGHQHRLPFTFFSYLTTSLFGVKAKLELAKLLWKIRGIDSKQYASMTTRQWLDENVHDAALRQFLAAEMRVLTYSDHLDTQSAAVSLEQTRIMIRRGILYVDEGWQKLVDSLHSAAVTAGVNFVTSSRIVGVDHDENGVRGIHLGGLELETRNDTLSVALPDIGVDGEHGTKLPASQVLLAVDPRTACDLVGDTAETKTWAALTPVSAACLDVALSSLPNPNVTFAMGIDQPTYLSVHSKWAQLTPKGGALIHVARYRKGPAAEPDLELDTQAARRSSSDAAIEQELELLLDDLQPGWRDVLVHRRYLPSMIVSNALVTPSTKRPDPVTSIRGLYLAGDWVGGEGLLSDAALTSARAAAKAILAT